MAAKRREALGYGEEQLDVVVGQPEIELPELNLRGGVEGGRGGRKGERGREGERSIGERNVRM